MVHCVCFLNGDTTTVPASASIHELKMNVAKKLGQFEPHIMLLTVDGSPFDPTAVPPPICHCVILITPLALEDYPGILRTHAEAGDIPAFQRAEDVCKKSYARVLQSAFRDEIADTADVGVLDLLIAHGASVEGGEMLEDDACTPLTLAVRKAKIDAIRFLVKCGANVHRADQRGYSPVTYASASYDAGVEDALLGPMLPDIFGWDEIKKTSEWVGLGVEHAEERENDNVDCPQGKTI